MISLLHPSRQRAEKSFYVCKKWLDRSGIEDVELIISIDRDDNQASLYRHNATTLKANYIVAENRSAIDAINKAAEVSKGDILIVVSDDTDCPENWGKRILDVTFGKRDFLLKVYDGIQRWIVTMPIMDRVYYNRFGYIYYPEYRHMFCDTELTHVADSMGKLIFRNDIVFKHEHYSVTTKKKDAVTLNADQTWKQGQDLYIKRAKEKFGLDINIEQVSDPGKYHLSWLTKQMGI